MKKNNNITRIAFRVDANKEIGMGHLMRCMTIIRELKKRGIKSTIYSVFQADKSIIGNVADYVKIEEKPFSKEEAAFIKESMNERNEEVVFIDSYSINEQYLEHLRPLKRILLVDSYCDYHVEMIIQPNAFLSENVFGQGNADVYLKGLEYQPIRDEFFEKQTKQNLNIKKILILSGGTFPQRFITRLVKKIENYDSELCMTIVLGNCVENEIKKSFLREIQNDKIEVCENVTNMSELMCSNDIVISACGSTVYEIMACRVPIITYSMADNQKLVLKKLKAETGLVYAGDVSEKDTIDNILRLLKKMECLSTRKTQIGQMEKTILHNGAVNIVNEILKTYKRK